MKRGVRGGARRRVTVLLVLGGLGVSLCHAGHRREFRQLQSVARRLVEPGTPADGAVLILSRWIYEATHSSRNADYFLLSAFGVRPLSILQGGGDCADKSRLLIALLETIGVSAQPVMLFDPATGRPCHTVVEARYAPESFMVIDPSFDLYFPRKDEAGYHDLLTLRRHPEIIHERVKESRLLRPWPSRVHFYRHFPDTYREASTYNWRKSASSRLMFRVASWAAGDEVHRLPRPTVLERPYLLCAVWIGLITVLSVSGTILHQYARVRLHEKKERARSARGATFMGEFGRRTREKTRFIHGRITR